MSSLDIVNTSMMNTDKYIFMAYTYSAWETDKIPMDIIPPDKIPLSMQ